MTRVLDLAGRLSPRKAGPTLADIDADDQEAQNWTRR
jgi:hypothetical protein